MTTSYIIIYYYAESTLIWLIFKMKYTSVFHRWSLIRRSLLNILFDHVRCTLVEKLSDFYFDFALHLSINGYLESVCGLFKSICWRVCGGNVGWASKEGKKDEARKGPRGSRSKRGFYPLILRLKLYAGEISGLRMTAATLWESEGVSGGVR